MHITNYPILAETMLIPCAALHVNGGVKNLSFDLIKLEIH